MHVANILPDSRKLGFIDSKFTEQIWFGWGLELDSEPYSFGYYPSIYSSIIITCFFPSGLWGSLLHMSSRHCAKGWVHLVQVPTNT